MRLHNKIAIVTGAAQGFGLGIAETFVREGALVALVDFNGEAAEKAAKDLGPATIAVTCDVSKAADVARAVETATRGLGGLDILVNNAGTNIPEPMLDVTEEHLDTVLNLNVRALYLTSQAAIRKMLEREDRPAFGGSIINLSSQMGHVGSPDRTVYCMTKHAVEGLTKAMALELAPHAIRVVTLCPTFVDTPLVRRVVDTEEKRARLFSRIPMGRLGTVDEIAATAVFLASPAAGMITGTHLLVDGGWTAQ